jgi:hypothetical protein
VLGRPDRLETALLERAGKLRCGLNEPACARGE